MTRASRTWDDREKWADLTGYEHTRLGNSAGEGIFGEHHNDHAYYKSNTAGSMNVHAFARKVAYPAVNLEMSKIRMRGQELWYTY